MRLAIMATLATAIYFGGCDSQALPIDRPPDMVQSQSLCGHAAGPCCAQDACDPGLTCVTKEDGPSSRFCYTIESQPPCGGGGEACCSVKENASGLAVWCLAGLGCTDGVCN